MPKIRRQVQTAVIHPIGVCFRFYRSTYSGIKYYGVRREYMYGGAMREDTLFGDVYFRGAL